MNYGRPVRRLLLILGLGVLAFPLVLYLRPLLLLLGTLFLVGAALALAILRGRADPAAAQLQAYARPSITLLVLAYVVSAVLGRLPEAAQPAAVLLVLIAAGGVAFYFSLAPGSWNRLFRGGGREILGELETLKDTFAALPSRFGTMATVVGPGASSGERVLGRICGVCDSASKGLNQGIGEDGQPVTRSQVADGLRRLVRDARQDTGVVATVLNPEGIRIYGECLVRLERLANKIE